MKTTTARLEQHTSQHPDFLGGHPAINFLNTLRLHEDVLTDTLQSDADVRSWMRRMGMEQPALAQPLPSGSLLDAARRLRTLALRAIQKRKAGKPLPAGEINQIL